MEADQVLLARRVAPGEGANADRGVSAWIWRRVVTAMASFNA
jgi:hypothetical protein